MKITTSKSGHIKADIIIHGEIYNIFKEKTCFLGIHLDFSTHQMCLYLGFLYIFIELFGVDRSSWGYATIDSVKDIFKWKGIRLNWHYTNHIPHDYFFNLGVTFTENHTVLFLWKLQLVIERRRNESKE